VISSVLFFNEVIMSISSTESISEEDLERKFMFGRSFLFLELRKKIPCTVTL
jgi:hypothetical protein